MQIINADEVVNQKRSAILIDVLSKESYEKAHIPGSINIPLKEHDFLVQVRKKVPDRSTPIIVYCMNSDCTASLEAAKILEHNGYKVMRFKGGLKEWIESDREVEKASLLNWAARAALPPLCRASTETTPHAQMLSDANARFCCVQAYAEACSAARWARSSDDNGQ